MFEAIEAMFERNFQVLIFDDSQEHQSNKIFISLLT